MSNEFKIGDRVRITAGVFARFYGDVMQFLGDGRIAVRVDVYGRAVAIDVRRSTIETTRDAP